MIPVIGVGAQLAGKEEPRSYGHRRGYIDAIAAAGGAPLLLPPLADQTTRRALYDRVDAVLLAGGTDVDPASYGHDRHPTVTEVDPHRDESEIDLIRWSLADGKPLFAICRGVQILNVALGGSLIQDIPSERPEALVHQTRVWRQLAHDLVLEPDSRLASLLGATNLQVNSLHHQAIDRLGRGLRIIGTAPDGIVEGVEGTNGSWLVGVQCHPEELWQETDPRWRRVFANFVQTAAR